MQSDPGHGMPPALWPQCLPGCRFGQWRGYFLGKFDGIGGTGQRAMRRRAAGVPHLQTDGRLQVEPAATGVVLRALRAGHLSAHGCRTVTMTRYTKGMLCDKSGVEKVPVTGRQSGTPSRRPYPEPARLLASWWHGM